MLQLWRELASVLPWSFPQRPQFVWTPTRTSSPLTPRFLPALEAGEGGRAFEPNRLMQVGRIWLPKSGRYQRRLRAIADIGCLVSPSHSRE